MQKQMKVELKHFHISTKQKTAVKKKELHLPATGEELIAKTVLTVPTIATATTEGKETEETRSLADDSIIRTTTFPVQKTNGERGEGNPRTEVTT